MSAQPPQRVPEPVSPVDDSPSLYSRGYLALLVAAALMGIPISVVSFAFLAAVHELEHLVWDTLPEQLGFTGLPYWWPILTLGIAGLIVAFTAVRFPGGGGHVPAMGMGGGGPTAPIAVPGVVLAAAASLSLGAVVGPEAPLIALGSGLAVLAGSTLGSGDDNTTRGVVAAAGSAAAVSAIFGNPLIAAVIILEIVGLARRQMMLVVVPCLISSGLGALVFTGLGQWTGLEIGALAIPDLPHANLRIADLLAALPLGAVVAAGVWVVFVTGRKTASLARSRALLTTVSAGVLAGASAAMYAAATDHSAAEVALSGQATLAPLAIHPGAWTAGALIALLICKSIAYALCIGVFRGGPVFPAIFLGATCGVLTSTLMPSVGLVPGLAMGMAAGAVAATRFPVTGIILVVLLLGDAANDVMPVVILAGIAALVVEELLTRLVGRPSEAVHHD